MAINAQFTPLPNTILDPLCRVRIPGGARQCLDAIIRQTYGWNRESDPISLTQFEEKTGLDRKSVCRAIKILKDMNLILIDRGSGKKATMVVAKKPPVTSKYSINADITTWKPMPVIKRGSGIKATKGSGIKATEKAGKVVAKKPHTTDSLTDKKTHTAKPGDYVFPDGSICRRGQLRLNNWLFCSFWDSYPKKIKERETREAWWKTHPIDKRRMIIEALRKQVAAGHFTENKRYIPSAVSWLDDHRWKDEIIPQNPPGNGNGSGIPWNFGRGLESGPRAICSVKNCNFGLPVGFHGLCPKCKTQYPLRHDQPTEVRGDAGDAVNRVAAGIGRSIPEHEVDRQKWNPKRYQVG